MKKVFLMGLVAIAALLFVSESAMAGLVVTSPDTSNLTSTILGGGITIVGTPTYTGAGTASGTFTGGISAGIGIDSGIIMTSGGAAGAVGPNNSDNYTVSNGTAGDANLTTLAGFPTYDAAVLEFDFTTAGGDLFFNYVFASEEYNEYANTQYNDIFGFFLDGNNIALIPSTTIPVAINTVNGGNPFGTNAQHPAYYNNNDLNDGGPFYNIQYDGFTDVFTAKALGLGSGTHHIKLAIADGSDSILDSAVFIQANSFSEHETNVAPEPSTILLLGSALFGLGFFVRKRINK